MKKLNRLLCLSTCVAAFFTVAGCQSSASGPAPGGNSSGLYSGDEARPANVLLIAIDDLNDWVGVLGGHPDTRTPVLDSLAASGMLFTNAHTQAPLCAPSRVALLTSMLPSTTGIYFQIRDTLVKESSPATRRAVSLPEYLAAQGFKTMGAGKIWHGNDLAGTFQEYGQAGAWFGPRPPERQAYDPEDGPNYDGVNSTNTDWGAWPLRDEEMSDYKYADWAIDKLGRPHDAPFLLAVGFVRPHVPWYVPPRWLETFDPDQIALPPYNPDDMDDIPQIARDLSLSAPMPTTEYLKAKGQWADAVRAYLASVHWVDHQVGRVLQALREGPHAENTLVVLFSDHGYHMGEKNRFSKMSLWERDTRVPVMISGPGIPAGRTTSRPVGLVDLYPTMLDLLGLPANELNEGRTLSPLIAEPQREWPHPALTMFGPNMVSVRGDRFRYIRYEDGSEEFYDHSNDPYEWTNLARDPAAMAEHRADVERLRAAIPDSMAPLVEHSFYTGNAFSRASMPRWRGEASQP